MVLDRYNRKDNKATMSKLLLLKNISSVYIEKLQTLGKD